MNLGEDLAHLRVEELLADAAARRLVREARASTKRRSRPSPLRTAVGTRLIRAGVRLGGEAPPTAALRSSPR